MSGRVPDRVGIVGAGQMGRGIAQVAAQAGADVVLLDATPELAAAAAARVGATLDRLVERGKLSAADADAAKARIRPAGDVAALADRELVIEAAPEDESVKAAVLAAVCAAAPDALVATNTSSISITKLAACTDRPDRFAGMHFFNPVPLMGLVEIIRGLATSDATAERVTAAARAWGKTTVASRDVPGFIVNRLLIPFLNEACFALYEGLGTAEDIDAGVRLGLNHPMGPLELADFIGLDTCLAVAEVLHRELGEDKYRPSPLLRQYVAAGWLGRKSGRGFYDHSTAEGQA